MFWTDERVGSLNKHSREGLSPAEIARLDDFSHVDVIGNSDEASTALVRVEAEKAIPGDTAMPLLERRSVRERNPLAVYLTIYTLDRLVRELVPFYGVNCPIAVVLNSERPEARIIRGTFATIEGWAMKVPIERSMLVLVG